MSASAARLDRSPIVAGMAMPRSESSMRLHARARELLLEYLSPAQREMFRASGHFDVDKTGEPRSALMWMRWYPDFRVYRLSASRLPVALFTSAKRLARSRPTYAFCIHSRELAPKCDELLSLKLLLEHDEPRFVRIACRIRLFRTDWPLLGGLDDGLLV